MTNKNRKRGCPLNYLHYFVGEEVEKLLQDGAVLNIEFYFHRPILRFLKEYIGYEERLTWLRSEIFSFIEEEKMFVEGKICLDRE